jgi:hypothetical protein
MKNLKIIMLVLVLAAGISIVPVAGLSTTHVFYDIQPMTEEELAFAEATCPFGEENLESSQQSTQMNPLPSDSAIVEFNGATDEAREFIEIWQSTKPMTGKELALANARCPFSEENLFSCLLPVQQRPQFSFSPAFQDSLFEYSGQSWMEATIMNAYRPL